MHIGRKKERHGTEQRGYDTIYNHAHIDARLSVTYVVWTL